MSDWSDIPIAFDRPDWCPDCQGTTIHTVRSYKDVEYRRCTRCGRRVEIKYAEDHHTQDGFKERKEDRTKDDYDFKRAADRRYRPRRNKDDRE